MAKYHYSISTEAGKHIVRVYTGNNFVLAISIHNTLGQALHYIQADNRMYHT